MKPSFIAHILTSIKHQKSFRESQYGATSFAYVHSDHFALLTCQQKYKHAHPYSTHTRTHTYPQDVHGCGRCAATLRWAFQHFWSDQQPAHSFPLSLYLHRKKYIFHKSCLIDCTAQLKQMRHLQ